MNKIEEIEKYMRRKVLLDEAVKNLDLYDNKYNNKDELRAALKNDGYSDEDISSSIDLIGLNKNKPQAETGNKENVETQSGNPNLTTNPTPEQINDIRNTLNANPQGETNNQETPNPQSSEVQNTEQSFANEWTAIVKEVGTIKNNFTALTNDAKARGYIKNPQVLNKIQGVAGVIAGIGSAATMVGTILSFIPGMQPLAMALRSGGMLAGGIGTAGNRGIASVRDFKNKNYGSAFANLGMATLGGMSAFAGGKMLGNQIATRTDNLTKVQQPQQDTSKFGQGQVNQVPQNHQNQIGSGAPANPTPQGFDATLDTINKLTNGNQADWPHNPAVQAAFTPEQIAIMRNTINTSPQGITQMGELSAAQAAESRAQDAFTQGQDYSELQARENAGAEYAANKVNAFTNTANNLQNQFDNTDFRGGGRETAGRTEYATNLMNNINKNRELADSWQDTRDSFVANGDRFGSQAQNFNNLGQSEQAAAAAHMNNYNKGL